MKKDIRRFGGWFCPWLQIERSKWYILCGIRCIKQILVIRRQSCPSKRPDNGQYSTEYTLLTILDHYDAQRKLHLKLIILYILIIINCTLVVCLLAAADRCYRQSMQWSNWYSTTSDITLLKTLFEVGLIFCVPAATTLYSNQDRELSLHGLPFSLIKTSYYSIGYKPS
jgi:hypothetical protein